MILWILVIFILILVCPESAFAHTPHDEMELVRLSSTFLLDHTIFAVARGNIFASFNAGADWSRKNIGLPHARVRDLVLSTNYHNDKRMVVATDSGVYWSNDAGDFWQKSVVIGYKFEKNKTQMDDAYFRPQMTLSTSSVANIPIFAALINGLLLESRDCGKTWKRVFISSSDLRELCIHSLNCYVGDAAGNVMQLDIHDSWILKKTWQIAKGFKISSLQHNNDGKLFIGTAGGGMWALDTVTSTIKNLGLEDKYITSICLIPWASVKEDKESCLIGVTEWNDGVYFSADGGDHWQESNKGLSKDSQADEGMFKVPHFKSITALSTAQNGYIAFVSGFDGLFKIEEPNHHWIELKNLVTHNIVVGLSVGYSQQGNLVAISSYCGGGHTISNTLNRGNSYDLTLESVLKGVRTFAVTIPPEVRRESQKIWVAIHDTVKVFDRNTLLMRDVPLCSNNKEQITNYPIRKKLVPFAKKFLSLLPLNTRATMRRFLQKGASRLNLNIKTNVFGARFVFSPQFSDDGVAYLSTWQGGLFQTSDGGKSFIKIWYPPEKESIMCVAVSSNFTKTKCVYLISDSKLWRTCDTGETWVIEPNVPAQLRLYRIALGQMQGGQEKLFLSSDDGFYTTTVMKNGNLYNWQRVLDSHSGYIVTDVALAPDFSESGIVIINKAGQGLLRSDDNGVKFHSVYFNGEKFKRDCSIMPGFPDAAQMIAFSPEFKKDSTVYASADSEIFISTDRGINWKLFWKLSDELLTPTG